MLYSTENLKESYVNNKRIVQKINCAMYPFLKIELKEIEDYKSDAVIHIFDRQAKLEIKQRKTKNMTNWKAYKKVWIHKSSVDNTDADMYMIYGCEYNTIMFFDVKDIDKSKVEICRSKGLAIEMYAIDIRKCMIINLNDIIETLKIQDVAEYISTLNIEDTEKTVKMLSKVYNIKYEELLSTILEYIKNQKLKNKKGE